MLTALSLGCPISHSLQNGCTVGVERQWNSLVKQDAKLKDDRSFVAAYGQMQYLSIFPDNFALPLVLKACSRLDAVEFGEEVHSLVLGSRMIKDLRVVTALIDFYCMCGKIEGAWRLSDGMQESDVVWNATVHGHVDVSKHNDAMSLLTRMGTEVVRPNLRKLVAVLMNCAELLELRIGKVAHCYCLRCRILLECPHVVTALIGFYLSFDEGASQIMFDMMTVQNVACSNAMITGHFELESYERALNIFLLHFSSGGTVDSVTMLW